MTSATIRRQDLYMITVEAVTVGLAAVEGEVCEGRFIKRYFNFPALGTFTQYGLPHFCFFNSIVIQCVVRLLLLASRQLPIVAK